MSTATQGTQIEADPDLPKVRIVREFDAPVELVYRAHVEPDLIAQWLGPASMECRIEKWDMRTGGEYRYTALRDGEEVAHFYGSVHRVWEGRKIVQTFGFDEMPEAVSLDTLELHDLGDGRTRLEIVSVVDSMEAQAGMMASGMEVGVNEGYAALDSLLTSLVEEVAQRPSRDQGADA
ncbi:SRPBCC family protein [Nocardioides sp. MH1]|uniref:SRPBCC family protein n=1 Tax=Nocardioides sp. MH1 TaxID=3242490 RepID=UPI0035216C0F